ncbi:MAG: hypothetical protein Q6353_015495 [Candidatus Sigynarchaeum springense]
MAFGGILLLFLSTMPGARALTPANAPCTITMDGSIGSSEWACADKKAEFFLDVNNDPDGNGHVNVDGNNYLYLAEDPSNLYVGLDLCSDRSTDEAMEWVGVWLVTAGRTFNSWVEWDSYLNNGVESLMYSVPNQALIPFLSNVLVTSGVYVDSESENQVISGVAQGNASNFDPASVVPFNITAAYDSGYHTRVDFTLDLAECFGVLTQERIDHVEEVRIYITSNVNTSIGSNDIIVWYPNNTYSISDPDQVIHINGGTSQVSETIHIGKGNITTSHQVKFSLKGDSPSPFKQIIHSLSFAVLTNDTSAYTIGYFIYYPYSTIRNFQIAKSFGSSQDAAASHRMFEIRIPKSEIEHYDSNGNLGIIVGGYGTLALPNSNYWVYSKVMTEMPIQQSDKYYYFNMQGLETPNGVPGYDLLILASIAGGLTACLAIKRNKVTRKQ